VIGGLSYAALHNVTLAPGIPPMGPSPICLHGVPDDVRGDHSSAYRGRFAERLKFSAFLLSRAVGHHRLRSVWAHWVWRSADFLRNYGRSTLPAGSWCTSVPGCPRSRRLWVVGRRRSYPDTGPPHKHGLSVLGPRSCGLGGSFSMGAARSLRGLSTLGSSTRSSPRCPARSPWVFLDWFLAKRPHPGPAVGSESGLAAYSGFRFSSVPWRAWLSGRSRARCATSGDGGQAKLVRRLRSTRFGIHGVAGTWGVLAVGPGRRWSLQLPHGANGLFHSGAHLLWYSRGRSA